MDKTTSTTTRFEELDSKFWSIAYIMNNAEYTPEDVHQHIIVKLLEKVQEDPKFLSQKDSFIVGFAKWRAQSLIEKSVVYGKYVDSENNVASDEDFDEDDTSSFDRIAQQQISVEDQVILREETQTLVNVVKKMDIESQRIVKMIFSGYSKAEIAAIKGWSRAAVTIRCNKISEKATTTF